MYIRCLYVALIPQAIIACSWVLRLLNDRSLQMLSDLCTHTHWVSAIVIVIDSVDLVTCRNVDREMQPLVVYT